MTEPTDAQYLAMVQLVSDALELRPKESLAQAAFRVVRHNTAARIVQDCARAILAATGKGPEQQWAAVAKCHRLLTTAPPPTNRGDTNG